MTDCKSIIEALQRAGVSLYKIALLMTQEGRKTQYTQVKAWSEGKEPREGQAKLLRQLHERYVSRETLKV